MAGMHTALHSGNINLPLPSVSAARSFTYAGRNLCSVEIKLPVGISRRGRSRGPGRREIVRRRAMGKVEAAIAAGAMPESHVWPEGIRPSIKHDVFQVDLPVVDLAPVFQLEELIAKGKGDLEALQAQKQAILSKVKEGCQEYGFFQVVNHGFPMEVVDEVTKACHAFFQQPSEVKVIAASPPQSQFGYTSMTKTISHYPAFRWHEGVGLPSHHQASMLDAWAESLSRAGFGGLTKEQISALFTEYGKHGEALVLKLMELVAESLGLHKDYFAGEFTSRSSLSEWPRYFTRLNYYPRCPRPDLALGVPGHIDPGVLTLLHQDAVGGLQILSKDGQQWLGVQPIPGAFVINAGDILQVWSNNRYLSAEHRVVTNDKSARLSIAHFFNPHDDTDIAISPQLVDAEHPLRYRTFKSQEYFKLIAPLGIKGREHLTRHFKL